MFILDYWYFVFLLPGILIAAWAQWRVHSAFSEASKIRSASGLSGAEAASALLRSSGIDNVRIEPVEGFLSDHYDPSAKVLRLSPPVYRERSLAALGVAAHEAGHAFQDAQRYAPLVVRNALVPMASIGSNLSFYIILAGLIIGLTGLLWIGIGLFSLTVLFQLVNLPVEFDASRRAREHLLRHGIITPQEDETVGKVLNAAAMTYVAATLTSILTLLYFLFRAGAFGNRDE